MIAEPRGEAEGLAQQHPVSPQVVRIGAGSAVVAARRFVLRFRTTLGAGTRASRSTLFTPRPITSLAPLRAGTGFRAAVIAVTAGVRHPAEPGPGAAGAEADAAGPEARASRSEPAPTRAAEATDAGTAEARSAASRREAPAFLASPRSGGGEAARFRSAGVIPIRAGEVAGGAVVAERLATIAITAVAATPFLVVPRAEALAVMPAFAGTSGKMPLRAISVATAAAIRVAPVGTVVVRAVTV